MSKIGTDSSNSGQAIFELIAFMPFFIVLLSVLLTIGSSINGSINQGKAARGYFFFLAKGNSYLPNPVDLEAMSGVGRTGSYFIGWQDYKDGEAPIATCYKLNALISGNKGEKCETPISGSDITRYVRLYTVFGICTATFERREGSGPFAQSINLANAINAGTSNSCTRQ
jgi:hypothetical protein